MSIVAKLGPRVWAKVEAADNKRISSQTLPEGVQAVLDVPYLEDGAKEHLLDIYTPDDFEKPLPLIIDIHGGGRDLVFPHHENEIAQSEALTGKRFVRYWTHNGLIKVNGQKMSKSLGNSLLLDDLMDKFSPDALKFALLSSNYRGDVNITDDLFPAAEAHVARFYALIERAEQAFPSGQGGEAEIDERFDAAMEDDFNTALALSDLFGYFKEVARLLGANDPEARRITNQIRATYALLGLFKKDPASYLAQYGAKEEDVPAEVRAVADERFAARREKNWAKSDVLREKLRAMGYAVKDGKDGYTLSRL